MSKKSKGKRAEEKKKDRASKRAAKKALYEAYAQQGRDKGSRRSKRKIRMTPGRGAHLMDNCGNVGCKRCNPRAVVFHKAKMKQAA